MSQTRYRIATDQKLAPGAAIMLEGNAAHYLANVLRLKTGDAISLFNRTDGEWRAELSTIAKKSVTLTAVECTRVPLPPLPFTVCFAPIKGGRLETIIEKATELGASVLQPVITRRTIVDKVNLERAESIAREAAEQCERIDWPEIREPVKFERFLADWPVDTPLYYGDETGTSSSIIELLRSHRELGAVKHICFTEAAGSAALAAKGGKPTSEIQNWAILAGPEGGFAPEELALLQRCKAAVGVGLGPRILRADTAVITLSALTLAALGDWHQPPRFTGDA